MEVGSVKSNKRRDAASTLLPENRLGQRYKRLLHDQRLRPWVALFSGAGVYRHGNIGQQCGEYYVVR